MFQLNSPWHQSDVNNYLTCPQMAYFRTYLQLPEPGRHPNAVTGSTLHWAIEQWHNEKQPAWNREHINGFVAYLFEQTILGHDPMTILHKTDELPPVEWEWSKDSREELLEKAQQCFFLYTCQPHNIEANVIQSEAFFRFKYWGLEFEGSMDQLRRMPDESIELWDFKFSAFTPHREFLNRAIQFTIYSYALWKGDLFDTDDNEEPIPDTKRSLGILPDRCVWYHLPHLVPYKRNGKNGSVGDPKGEPRYTFTLSKQRILFYMKNIRKIISQFHQGKFYLAGKQAGSCNGFCHFHDACANWIDGLPIETIRETTAEDFAAIL
jgi:hypothetical protein